MLKTRDQYLTELRAIQDMIRPLRGTHFVEANRTRYVSYTWDELHRLGADVNDPAVIKTWVNIATAPELEQLASLLATVSQAAANGRD